MLFIRKNALLNTGEHFYKTIRMNKSFEKAKDLFESLLENICYENEDPYLEQIIYGIQQEISESETIDELIALSEELLINIRDFNINEETYEEAENFIYRLQEFLD